MDSKNAIVLAPNEERIRLGQSGRPVCPKCGANMYLRRASTGPRQGQRFWGCDNFFSITNKCTHTMNITREGTWTSTPKRSGKPKGITVPPRVPKPVSPVWQKPKKEFVYESRGEHYSRILDDDADEQMVRADIFIVTMMYIPTGKITETSISEKLLQKLMTDAEIEIQKILQQTLTSEQIKYDVTDRFLTDDYLLR